jgi:hypothetical protein
MAKPTTQKPKPLIPKKALDDVLARLLAVPKAEVDAAVAKPVRPRKKAPKKK